MERYPAGRIPWQIIPAVAACALLSLAQTDAALEQGRSSYRANCAFCHGLGGRGGRGPDLTSDRLTHANSDEDIKRVIRNGVPGTNMAAFEFEDDELDTLVRFIRHLSQGLVNRQPVSGDPAAGRRLYAQLGCAACHRIGEEGSVFGPDLSRIGASRPVAYLRESIADPSADISPEWEGVSVVTQDGKRITGVRINEDTFTIQFRDQSQAFRMFLKSESREVLYEKKSLMPPFRLPKEALDNLLAYLASLRGESPTPDTAGKAEGTR